MGNIYAGDIGTEIVVDTGSDITGATITQLLVRNPDYTEHVWEGSIFDTNKIKYIIKDGDIPTAGKYMLQSYVSLTSFTGRGETAFLEIQDKWS